jgi:hypothetical protein
MTGDGGVTDEEIEVVAEELAKVGGISWYPGRTRGPLLRSVTQRYKDRARIAIAALDRLRASKNDSAEAEGSTSESLPFDEGSSSDRRDQLQVGATVVYRPPGDKRAISCRIEQLEEGRAYLVHSPRPDVGWVSLDNLQPLSAGVASKGE